MKLQFQKLKSIFKYFLKKKKKLHRHKSSTRAQNTPRLSHKKDVIKFIRDMAFYLRQLLKDFHLKMDKKAVPLGEQTGLEFTASIKERLKAVITLKETGGTSEEKK